MSSEKATGLVLRTTEFSETSVIAMVFTREFGKIHGLAKGARRPKSAFDSALDLLACCRLVFLRKSSGSLDLFTEAKLERRFRPADRDLSRLYAGYYVAELLNELTDDYDPHPELFDAACATLVALADSTESAPRSVLRFEMLALSYLGHAPALEDCAACGTRLPRSDRVAFGHLVGGLLCVRCRPGKSPVVSLSWETLNLLRVFGSPDSDAWRDIGLDRRSAGEARGVVNGYIAHLLGHRPRMHSYLGILAED